LELRFRPSDRYCAPALSKTTVVSNLVLKVKRRRKASSHSVTTEPGTKQVQYEYSAELMGICNKTYIFAGMYADMKLNMFHRVSP
jgi:hypothetical protein